jgi:hypothetical protein
MVGRCRHGLNRRLLDFARSVHCAIDYALEHSVQLAIFAGDICKHRDPDPPGSGPLRNVYDG